MCSSIHHTSILGLENLRGAYKTSSGRERDDTHQGISSRICIPVQRTHMDQHKSLVLHTESADEINLFLRGAKQDSRLFIHQRKKYGRLLALELSF